MTNEEAKEVLISILRDINSESDGFEYTSEQFTEAMLIAIDALSKPSLPINIDEDKLIESELDKKWLVERDMEGNVINGVSEWKDRGSLMNFPAVFDLVKYFYHLGKQNICIPSNLDEAADEYASTWIYGSAWYDAVKNTFKAGVKWMAGQGYTKEGIARPDDCEI